MISGLSDDVTSAQKKINAVLRSKNLKIWEEYFQYAEKLFCVF